MKKVVLLAIVTLFIVSSILVRATPGTKSESGFFVLEKFEYRDDLYKYLFCLLTLGETETRNAIALSKRCKDVDLQNKIMIDKDPTEQMAYSSIRGYEPDAQKLIRCVADGGSRKFRTDTKLVVDYCDKVIQPLD